MRPEPQNWNAAGFVELAAAAVDPQPSELADALKGVLTYRSGAGNAVALPSKESVILISIPTKAVHNDAAATDAAVARGTEAPTPIVESAAEARELSDGFAAEFKRIVGLTVDAYRQASHYLGDPTAWV